MRVYCLFIFTLIFIVPADGQSLVDSLTSRLENVGDSLRGEILVNLFGTLSSQDSKKSLQYAQECEQLARETGDLLLLAKSLNGKAVAYYYLNEMDLSNELYFEALSLFDSLDYKPGVIRALNNIGWNFRVQELFDEATVFFNQGLELALEINDKELLQAIYNNLGTVYRETKKFDQAMDIYHKSLEINRQTGNQKWEAYNLNNIGMIYMEKEQYDDALEYLDQAKKINLESGFLQEYVRNTLNIGKVYSLKKEYRKAQFYISSVDSLIKKDEFQRERIEYFGYQVELNEKLGEFEKALEFQRAVGELRIELNKVAYDESIAEIQTKYELAQRAKEVEIYEKKVIQQRFIIFGGTAAFFFMLGILFLVLRLYKSKNRWALHVEYLNKEIQEKAEELKSINEEIQGVNSNLEKIVEERTEKIKAQNQKLVKYAFINSHEIRGPLARILGLLYLIGLEGKLSKDDPSYTLLKNATEELDEVIKETSQILEDEDISLDD